ncbi:protease modulator HflK [Alteraurantiacibacter palmitatis]|uniref:Protease modulator HflK n=1 Tax=Alteraurantiacibacter palmitatis TaxID=2054628 RepID=A0ABV7E697_9SPHN
MAGKRNPWGGSGDGGSDGGNDGNSESPESGAPGEGLKGEGKPPRGPRNPWLPGGSGGSEGPGDGQPPRRSASIEDLFKQRGPEGPRRSGGGGPRGPNFRMPQRPGGGSWLPLALGAVAAVWLFVSSVHFVQPREQAVVTWLGGRFSHTLNPGTNFTMPWPIHVVDVENVSEIRIERIPAGNEEKLILTADQNLVNLSYLIRWNISDLSLYRFQLSEPNETLLEVGEAAMRAAVAEQDLDTVLTGEGRATIEGQVRRNMQGILDAFRSGILVQGVEIARTDAPSQVIEAFNDVLAARQNAERNLNDARRYEQQLLAQAQGDAAAFDNIYAEYRLAPEVTRRRLYYETMENVLANTDKTIVEATGVTPYLPLPELRRRAAASAAAAAAPAAPATGGQ